MNEVSSFINECEVLGFPTLYGAKFMYILNNKYYYNDGESYTAEELYSSVKEVENLEEAEADSWNLFMSIDSARQEYLDIHGHI